MRTKELLIVLVTVVASHVMLARSSSSSTAESVDRDPSRPARRRRDGSQQGTFHLVSGVGDDGGQSWTVRRRVSTGSAANVSSPTRPRLTAEQWRSRERSVPLRPSYHSPQQPCLISRTIGSPAPCFSDNLGTEQQFGPLNIWNHTFLFNFHYTGLLTPYFKFVHKFMNLYDAFCHPNIRSWQADRCHYYLIYCFGSAG